MSYDDDEEHDFWDDFEPPPDWIGDIDFNTDREVTDDELALDPNFIARITQENGIIDVGEVIIDINDAAGYGRIYAKRFPTLEQGLLYLYRIGVLSFSSLAIDEEGYFVPVIPTDTP